MKRFIGYLKNKLHNLSWKKISKWSIVFCGITWLTVWLSYHHIQKFSASFLYTDASKIPYNKVGLVLGTSKTTKHGYNNPYFTYRVQAAKTLYAARKIKIIIVSGDNRFNDYNEPKDMHDALVQLGVPDSVIVYDYAGLRTFDSMIRCKTIFSQDSITVISQKFHNERAVYIARHNNITCIGFNAQTVSYSKSFMVTLREYFSRFKCLLDVYVLNTKPKHGGEKITI
jgi:SanA protein